MKFLMLVVFLFLFTSCNYIVSSYIDEEIIIKKINDSIFIDLNRNELLKSASKKEDIFLPIIDNVSKIYFDKHKIYIESENKYFVYSKDSLNEVHGEEVNHIKFKNVHDYID